MVRPLSSVVATSLFAAPAESEAAAIGSVRQKEAASTGLAIRAICRRFRISGSILVSRHEVLNGSTRNLTENFKPEWIDYRAFNRGRANYPKAIEPPK